VFFTPGWQDILTVAGTAGGTLAGVIITQVFSLKNKRIDAEARDADRQHEQAMRDADRQDERRKAYEARAWQAKHDALTRLISVCRFVKLRAAESTDEHFRRGATIRALDQFRQKVGGEDGISEVTAYAAKPVCAALDEMLNEVDAQEGKHTHLLSELGPIGAELYALNKESLTDVSGARIAELYDRRKQVFDALGRESDLEVARVTGLCDRVIDLAKQDLEGLLTE
jgi:hypothetical protein